MKVDCKDDRATCILASSKSYQNIFQSLMWNINCIILCLTKKYQLADFCYYITFPSQLILAIYLKLTWQLQYKFSNCGIFRLCNIHWSDQLGAGGKTMLVYHWPTLCYFGSLLNQHWEPYKLATCKLLPRHQDDSVVCMYVESCRYYSRGFL